MVLNDIFTEKGKISSQKFVKFKNTDEWKDIVESKASLNCLNDAEILYCYMNNISEEPKCYCGKHLGFPGYSLGYHRFCSVKCSVNSTEVKEKKDKTSFERYGTKNGHQSDEAKEKRKNTNILRYNAVNPFQSEICMEKARDTMFSKYGVYYSSQSEELLEKRKITYLNNLGVDHPFKSKDVLEKCKLTWNNIYGVDNPFQSEICMEKAKETSRIRYGVDYPMQSEEVRGRCIASFFRNYGVDNPSKSQVIKDKKKKNLWEKRKDDPVYQKLTNKEWMIEKFKSKTIVMMAEEIGCSQGTVGNYLTLYEQDTSRWSSASSHELEIRTFIKSLIDDNMIFNSREIIYPKELDIYIPSRNLAIEMNGLVWHSSANIEEETKFKDYHLNKTNQCLTKNIDLLHLTDYEWIYQTDICKSIISDKLNLNVKINAKDLTYSKLSKDVGRSFMIDNHIQGPESGGEYHGLYLDDDLLAVLHIKREKSDRNYDYHITRYASKIHTDVSSGIQFILDNIKIVGKIKYTVNKCYFSMNNLLEERFRKVKESFPMIWYLTPKYELESGNKYTKEHVKQLLPNYNDSLTFDENLYINGYKKYFDVGYTEYELVK